VLIENGSEQVEGLLGSVFDTMTEGFSIQQIITDASGAFSDLKYIAVNSAFERSTGLKGLEVIGKTKLELFAGTQWLDCYANVVNTGAPCRFEAVFGPLGRCFQVSAFKIDPRYLAILFFDITDRRHAEDAVEAASKAKDDFIAVMSHELRTPLTPALAAIQLLEAEKTLSPDHHEILRMIRRNVQLEARLIDDLLDVTRIARNKIELYLARIEIHEKIAHVLGICAVDAQAKQVLIDTDLSATVTDLVADPARLQQIIWNVIKNAIKFTDIGGRILIRTENPKPDEIAIMVSDTGIGIDPAKLQNIFDAFEQGGREVTQRFGGLGLGLTISKALVEMHKGSIAAASDGIGKGATFTIRLPTAPKTPQPVHPAKPSVNALLSCTILLVEDHEDTRKIMTRLLTRLGCQVKPASTAAQALMIAQGERLDLVISDIGLPDMSGLELMRQLKERHDLRGIALSGFGMDEDHTRSKEAGFEVHLTKPINLQTLEDTVRRITLR
jgi:signal transduction histidine kinase